MLQSPAKVVCNGHWAREDTGTKGRSNVKMCLYNQKDMTIMDTHSWTQVPCRPLKNIWNTRMRVILHVQYNYMMYQFLEMATKGDRTKQYKCMGNSNLCLYLTWKWNSAWIWEYADCERFLKERGLWRLPYCLKGTYVLRSSKRLSTNVRRLWPQCSVGGVHEHPLICLVPCLSVTNRKITFGWSVQ